MSVWNVDPAIAALEQQSWLSEDNQKIVICDIVYHNGTTTQVGYFSNYPYITPYNSSFIDLLNNSVNNIPYIDNLINIPNIISRIDSDVNIGAIEFLNANGEFDDYITYGWEGWPLKIYIGDKSWIKDDFILILEAVSSVISSPRPNIMSLGIRDKKEVFTVNAQTQLIDTDYVSALYTNNSPAFIETLDNLISRSVPIEVVLADKGSSYTATEIANATAVALDGRPEFNASNVGSLITVTQVLTAAEPEQAHDGHDSIRSFDTKFGFTKTAGWVTPDWEQTIQCSTMEPDLNGKYFHIYTAYRSFYIWYNIDNGSVDPEAIDITPINFEPGTILIPETISNTTVPICLGYCFNIEPKLIDSNNHVYQVHEGTIDSILEVRSNGIPLDGPGSSKPQYEVNLDIGCFRLLIHQRSTQITCDVIGAPNRGVDSAGDSPSYTIVPHSAAWMVEWLALEKTSLLTADICAGTFGSFGNTSPLGLYIKDETAIAPLITDIMASVGGFARFDRICVLQIIRIIDPDTVLDADIVLDLNNDFIIEKGLSLSSTEVPKKSITLGFNRNWTIQDKAALAGLLRDSEDLLQFQDLYTSEYSHAVASNNTITNQYPLAEDKPLAGTLIIDFPVEDPSTSNAQAEVERRIGLRGEKRYVYKIKSIVAPFTLNVGDVIKVTHNRFGFGYGKKCIVIGMDEKPTKQKVDLEVWL